MMPDNYKAPYRPHNTELPKESVAPRPSNMRDSEYVDPGIVGKANTEGSADHALRFMKVVWACTTVMVLVAVVSFFALYQTFPAFTETVLGIIVGGI